MRDTPYSFYMYDMNEYADLVEKVATLGEVRHPRGLKTYDLGMVTLTMPCVGGFMPMGQGRGLRPAIGAVEAIQLIAGQPYPEIVMRVAPQFKAYMNDGSFHGAYGQRIGHQVQSVIKKLRADDSTRQAVITLWDPWLDNLDGMKDYPCTVALGFSICDGRLDLNVLMRSNDVWLGLPYDVFQFTQLQHTVARSLAVTTGVYRHTTWSLHLYDSNLESAIRFIDQAHETPEDTFRPSGIGLVGLDFSSMMRRAQAITRGREDMVHGAALTESERWYLEVMRDGEQPPNVG